MMEAVSKDYVTALNLVNTAIDHKEHCNHNCNVSLGLLKEATMFVVSRGKMTDIETLDVINRIAGITWF